MRIAFVADSHLSSRAPECVHNWIGAARAVAALRAELTVHLGDITLDGQSSPDELGFAGRLIDAWPTPMHCVPGNHDMGTGSGEEPVDPRRLAACEAAFGPGYWAVNCGDWQLLGVNAQLLGSGTPEEDQQWRWLEERATAGTKTHTALFLHRPLARPSAAERTRAGRYVADAARERLSQGPLHASLRCVFSGHTHQFLDLRHLAPRHVWVPSTAFVLPDAVQARVGEKVVGLGLLELEGPLMRFQLLRTGDMLAHDASRLAFWTATH